MPILTKTILLVLIGASAHAQTSAQQIESLGGEIQATFRSKASRSTTITTLTDIAVRNDDPEIQVKVLKTLEPGLSSGSGWFRLQTLDAIEKIGMSTTNGKTQMETIYLLSRYINRSASDIRAECIQAIVRLGKKGGYARGWAKWALKQKITDFHIARMASDGLKLLTQIELEEEAQRVQETRPHAPRPEQSQSAPEAHTSAAPQ